MSDAWEHKRSRFNHDWLKNQFIAAVLKCRQVRGGIVLNDMAEGDLAERLLQWGEYRKIAESVVAEIDAALSRQDVAVSADQDNSVTRLVREASEMEYQRWLRLQRPVAAVAAARASISQLDTAVADALASTEKRGTDDLDANDLQPLMIAATQLSESFSRLTLCRQISLPA